MTAVTASFATSPSSSLSALRAERDRFVALAFCWADILVELDRDGRVAYAAGALEPFLGCSVGDLLGHEIERMVLPSDRAHLRDLLVMAQRRERIDHATLRLIGPKGVTAPLLFTGYQLQELNGHFFLALRHSGEAQRRAGFGRRRARDEDSGLLDSESFIEMVTGELASGATAQPRSMSLIVLPGYEDFRTRLVDTVERELLSAIGQTLQQASFDGDGAARLGPGRYGLVHRSDLDVGSLQNQIGGLAKEADPQSEGIKVETATVAIEAEASPETSDGLVYVLNRFRNGDVDATLNDLASSISALAHAAVAEVNRFRELVTKKQFEVVFQPILNARTGAIHYYEALARIPQALDGADIYEHIAFAEQTGLIASFDLAMMEKVLRWAEKNTSVNGKTCFGVNVSGRSVSHLSDMAQFERLLRNSPWMRGRLIIEITESCRIADVDAANEFVQRLREQGFRVALDDFGAGAANFEYLAKLNVDLIKFDGAALRGAYNARQGKAFVKALVAFCRELGVGTAAEMVESEELLEFARTCGVQFVQGFLFGRPRPDLVSAAEGIPQHVFPDRGRLGAAANG